MTLIKDELHGRLSSVKTAHYFGDYFKVVKVITPKTKPGQFNITVRMN